MPVPVYACVRFADNVDAACFYGDNEKAGGEGMDGNERVGDRMDGGENEGMREGTERNGKRMKRRGCRERTGRGKRMRRM